MTAFDVFNGDADGICSLLQMRQTEPRAAALVTGVKRDISLLERVQAGAGDQITVLDVAMEKNHEALLRVLAAGASVFYADHHYPGEIPDSDRLDAHIDTAPETCTSLIVNQVLAGAAARWAVVGAYGDNLAASADSLAEQIGLGAVLREQFRDLGTYINYNGYGPSLDDLHFAPDDLFQRLLPFADPEQFLRQDQQTFSRLQTGYREDMAAAEAVKPVFEASHAAVLHLPDAAWARRVSGVFSNELVNRYPERAHAVITDKPDGGLLVSVRAPLANRTGADEICRRFPTGGGRKAAAGINHLAQERRDEFIQAFSAYYAELSR